MKCLALTVAGFLFFQTCCTGVEAVGLKGACDASNNTCSTTATDFCDPVTNKCQRMIGQACTANSTDECVTTAACKTTNCTCPVGTLANDENTKCYADGAINGACTRGKTCTAGTCDQNALGGPKCKNKENEDCVAVGSCIKNAECTGANTKCTCKSGFTATANKTACNFNAPSSPAAGALNGACKANGTCDGASLTCDKHADSGDKCKTKVGENCGAKVECIKNADCSSVGHLCNCTDGYSVNTEKTVCESAGGGSTSLTASMLLLAAIFVTSRFL